MLVFHGGHHYYTIRGQIGLQLIKMVEFKYLYEEKSLSVGQSSQKCSRLID